MTTLHLCGRNNVRTVMQHCEPEMHVAGERREHRRFDMEQQSIRIDRWEGSHKNRAVLGTLIDLSAGGARIRTTQANLQPDQQIRVRVELPTYSGICPFVDTTGGQPM